MKLAVITPMMNGQTWLSASVPRNAPSISEPSISACGLAHDTITAVSIAFFIVMAFCCVFNCTELAPRRMPYPIQITSKPPSSMTISFNISCELISAPIPKNAAIEKAASASQTNKTYRKARRRRLFMALLNTYKFCIPIGAINANPIIMPFKTVIIAFTPLHHCYPVYKKSSPGTT